jgi:murein DD-endopeptidase MepM/ murein hydrolase activator NlpD
MTTRPEPTSNRIVGLAQFLAAIKDVEGGDYGRNGPNEGGVVPFGAYGMLRQNWDHWSTAAGLPGHDPTDPAAQDRVAAFWGQKLFQRYGSWEMAAAAWFAGAEQTDAAAQSGKMTDYFQHANTKSFLGKFTAAMQKPEVQKAKMPRAGAQWINAGGVPKGWLMPVAGAADYSNSFLVPRDNKSGIHGAIDVYAKRGTPIVAPVGGRVISTTVGDKGGYTVRIQGEDGLTYYFAHMNEQAVVKPGQQVTSGTHLGFVGNSGNAQGTTPHLHFSVRKGGTIVNPYSYLQGARNAGNYYAPDQAGHEMAEPSTSEKYTSMLNVLSNQVAGGMRVDYRTLGMGSTEDETEQGQEPKAQEPI